MMFRFRFTIMMLLGLLTLLIVPYVGACGGLFCQNIPVDQQAERIIFTINDDDTVTAYVQINYTGSAHDFSWVVPLPAVPEVDVAEIASFDELSNFTQPMFIPPLMPECAPIPVPMAALSAAAESEFDDAGVEVLAQGTAGPFAFDVVRSDDPNALITWLRTNSYVITEQMEPLVRVYTDEGQVFLAMKLQPESGVQDIQPVKMTYAAENPVIPIRLTAVAANPNMSVLTWIFADAQAVPLNYAHPTIDERNLRSDFSTFGGTNYLSLVDQTVDLYDGRAFITEYAQTTTDFLINWRPSDPLVVELSREFDYMTRLFGRISPEEMTVDPVFTLDGDMPDVSNVRDLSGLDPEVFWNCDNTPIDIRFDPSALPSNR